MKLKAITDKALLQLTVEVMMRQQNSSLDVCATLQLRSFLIRNETVGSGVWSQDCDIVASRQRTELALIPNIQAF